jgi:predicted  nucleic acid-binding Zn-ribbon protein
MKEEDFSAFLQLQEQEEEVFKRERYLERLKKRIKELNQGINEILEEQASLIAELNQIIEAIREEDLKVRRCKENLKRCQERAKSVKKIEEYKALLRERAKNEDCIIKGEQALRELRQKRKAIEDRLQDKVKNRKLKRMEEEREDLIKEKEEVERELKQQMEKLELLRASFSKDLVQEYEKLKQAVGFPPIVKADIMGICSSCGTKLPSMLYSKLIKGEKVRCPSCGKILY